MNPVVPAHAETQSIEPDNAQKAAPSGQYCAWRVEIAPRAATQLDSGCATGQRRREGVCGSDWRGLPLTGIADAATDVWTVDAERAIFDA